MHSCYILYSPSLNRYYIGYTSDALEERLRKHNTNHKGFTGKATDWQLKWYENFNSATEAKAREKQLKNWKNRERLEKLINS